MTRIGNISFFCFCWKNENLDWPKCARTKDTIHFTNHFDSGWKENSLKIDWDPVELSGKLLWFQRNRGRPKKLLCQLNWSLESRCLSAEQKYFLSILSVKCSGQMIFLWIRLPARSTLTAKFSFCVFIFSTWYVMTCHDTKNNSGLYRFIPVSNTITITVVSFPFYTSYSPGIKILSYV